MQFSRWTDRAEWDVQEDVIDYLMYTYKKRQQTCLRVGKERKASEKTGINELKSRLTSLRNKLEQVFLFRGIHLKKSGEIRDN